jgi:hypothetical protein
MYVIGYDPVASTDQPLNRKVCILYKTRKCKILKTLSALLICTF